jgi:HSP20 family protein
MSTKTEEKNVTKGGDIQEARPAQALTPYEEMDRLFDRFLSRTWLSPFRFEWPEKSLLGTSHETRIPNLNIIDRDDEIEIQCETPGVDKKDLEVTMTDNTVTIKGKTRKEEKEEKGDFFRREISSGSFCRTVSLPCDVDSEKTKSSFRDGMLVLTAPKTKAVKRHTIKL